MMEEQGYIELKIEGIIGGKPLNSLNIDITEIRDLISDIESFLYPNKSDKSQRPHISYRIEDGSAKNIFYLPISAVLLFNGLLSEIKLRNNLDFLDIKRAEIINKIQKKAIDKSWEFSFYSSLKPEPILIINNSTHFIKAEAGYIDTEFILYGKIIEEGGSNPNFHLITKEYGKLTISATESQLLEGEKRLFKIYGVKASGKQNLKDGKPFDLKLIEYITYNPSYDEAKLDLLIERASEKLNTIPNVDNWLLQLRGGANG